MSKNIYKIFGLQRNPFFFYAPMDKKKRSEVFTGREREKNLLYSHVLSGANTFVCGMYGVGKTMLVLQTLDDLRSENYLCVYGEYNSGKGFWETIIKCLEIELREKNTALHSQLIEIFQQTNLKFSDERSEEQGLDAGASVPFLSATAKKKTSGRFTKSVEFRIDSTEDKLFELFQVLKKHYTGIVIAIDNLHINTELKDINEALENSKRLVTNEISTILVGHPTGVTKSLTNATGCVLNKIELEQLDKKDLIDIMVNHLNTARDEKKTSTHPFSKEVSEGLAQEIAELQLTPRLFNFSCFQLLDQAAIKNVSLIDSPFWNENHNLVAKKLVSELNDEDVKIVKIIYKEGIVISNKDHNNLANLRKIEGGEYTGYENLLKKVSPLVVKDVLLNKEEGIILNPIFLNEPEFDFL